MHGTNSTRRTLTTAVLGTLIATASAHGTLIAADSFVIGADPSAGQYSAGDLFAGPGQQNPTIAGFSGAWTGNDGATAVASWDATVGNTVAPITNPTLSYSAGDRARFAGSDGRNRRVSRSLAAYAPSNTYYMSFLSQVATGDTDLDGFVGVGFTNNGPAGDPLALTMPEFKGLMFGMVGDSAGGDSDVVVRHQGASGMTNVVIANGVASILIDHTILKIDYNDDPSNPSGNSLVSVWYNPVEITDESSTAPTLTFRTFALSSASDMTQLTLAAVDYSKAASFDEPRLATTWAEVTGQPVPEPMSATALLLGGALALRRRSR